MTGYAIDRTCPRCNAVPGAACVNMKSGRPLVGFHPGRAHAPLPNRLLSDQPKLLSDQPKPKLGGKPPVPPPPRPKREVAVERVVQYRASDGTMHDSFHAAVKHDTTYAIETWLANWLHAERVAHPGTVAQALALALRTQFNITRKKGD